MNSAAQFMAIKKQTGKNILSVVAKHNLREIQAEIGADSHIDAKRIVLNQILAGAATAAEIAAHAKHLLNDAGVGVLRRDAVRAVEVVISLPPTSTINQDAFFTDSLAWVCDFFKVPVLSAVIHNDEAAPHLHVVLLPLVDGRMVGSRLMGDKRRLQAMQASFFENAGQRHGLVRPKAPRRLSSGTRGKAASMLMSAIQGSPELLDRPDVEQAMLDLLGRDPEPLLTALGLALPTPAKPIKSFVGIMCKPCKPEPKKQKPIGFNRHSKPIGFASEAPEKHQSLSCVGFAPESPTSQANSTDINALDKQDFDEEGDTGSNFTRQRDDEPVEYWDADLGEFRTPAVRQSATRLAGLG